MADASGKSFPTTTTAKTNSDTSQPAKALFRFFGAYTCIGPYAIEEFGQLLELPVDLAREGVIGGAAIVPDDMVKGIFTDEELERWDTHAEHAAFIKPTPDSPYEYYEFAPAEFMAKKKKVLQIVHDYRQSVLSDQDLPLPAPSAEFQESLRRADKPELESKPFLTDQYPKVGDSPVNIPTAPPEVDELKENPTSMDSDTDALHTSNSTSTSEEHQS